MTRHAAIYLTGSGIIWHCGPTLVGLPAVVAWMRGRGDTGFTVTVTAGWDGEEEP